VSILEHDFWVEQNLNKGRLYGFDAEGVIMKQQLRQSTSTRSSSINNYDAREMAIRLNESVAKAANEIFLDQLASASN